MIMMALGVIILVCSLIQYFRPQSKLARVINRDVENSDNIASLKNYSIMGITTGFVFILIGIIAKIGITTGFVFILIGIIAKILPIL